MQLTYVAFAQLAVKCGSAQSAMKNLSASREYSSSPQHHVELGLGILAVRVSLQVVPNHLLIGDVLPDLPIIQPAHFPPGTHFEARSCSRSCPSTSNHRGESAKRGGERQSHRRRSAGDKGARGEICSGEEDGGCTD